MTRAEGFAPIPTWMIRDAKVSIYALTVYAALSSRSGLREIIPGQGTLALEARCSERQVRRALAELEDLGVVTRVRRKNLQGRAPDGYTLHPNGLTEVPDSQAATPEVPDSEDVGTGLGEQGFRTESAITPLLGRDSEAEIDEAGPRKRGTRIPDPFFVTTEMKTWAASEVAGLDIAAHTREFVDHWRAASGQTATKRDWVAAWRNWMRKANRWQKGSSKPTPDARVIDGLERGRRLAAELELKGLAS